MYWLSALYSVESDVKTPNKLHLHSKEWTAVSWQIKLCIDSMLLDDEYMYMSLGLFHSHFVGHFFLYVNGFIFNVNKKK